MYYLLYQVCKHKILLKVCEILLDKYRNEFFETDGINIKELDQIINDDDLRNIIGLNNIEMGELINQNPIIAFYIYESECCNVNFMKTKYFQFITFITKKFFFKSNTNNNIFDSYIIIKN